MNKDLKIYLGLVVIILLIVIGIIYFKSLSEKDPGEKVMKCIAEKATMYSQTSCSHCIVQKEILGNYTSLFNIIECDEEKQKCIDAEITGTPTWVIDGKKEEGVRTIKQLRELTGC